MTDWLHDDLQDDLDRHLRANTGCMTWRNTPIGAVGSPRPDVYAIDQTYTFRPVTYEVKISRADFLSDITSGKWQAYLHFSSAVTFAVPKGLIGKDEVPKGCGLIERGVDSRHARRPTLQRINGLETTQWIKLLLREGDRPHSFQRSFRNEYDTLLNNLRARGALGQDVASALSNLSEFRRRLSLLNSGLRDADKSLEAWKVSERERFKTRLTEADVRNSAGWPELCDALGINPDASAWQIRDALTRAKASLAADPKVEAAQKALDQAGRALEQARKLLPASP